MAATFTLTGKAAHEGRSLTVTMEIDGAKLAKALHDEKTEWLFWSFGEEGQNGERVGSVEVEIEGGMDVWPDGVTNFGEVTDD